MNIEETCSFENVLSYNFQSNVGILLIPTNHLP